LCVLLENIYEMNVLFIRYT